MSLPKFKRKNYRASGRMVGQTFNPSGVSNTDPLEVCLMLEVGETVWESIGRMPLDVAYEKYPHAKKFMRLLGFNSSEFNGKAVPKTAPQLQLFG